MNINLDLDGYRYVRMCYLILMLVFGRGYFLTITNVPLCVMIVFGLNEVMVAI